MKRTRHGFSPLRALPSCFFLAIIVARAPSAAVAQPTTASAPPGVAGRILNATTSKPVAAASIAAGNTRTASDATGRFAIELAPGPWTIAVTADGYLTERVVVVVPARGQADIELLLVPERVLEEEVSVTAPAVAAVSAPATLPVRPLEVTSVAGGGENIFRVLQTMPGVTGTDDFGSRLSVRGGGPDQNLTMMDGVEIHNPYRLWGLTSAFNPETVADFELTAGAFSAKYGDRLSSLLVVNNRAGSSVHPLTGSAALSLTDTNVVFEGALPKERGSWIVTGRRTYYDLIAERFTDNDLPSFSDLQGRATWKLGAGRALTFFGLRSREATDASFDVPEESATGSVFTRARNDLGAATFATTFGTRAWSRTVASVYETTDRVDFGGSFRDNSRRSNAPDDLGAFDQSSITVTWGGT
ncbi:MAG: TonB-dependent receptor, partial [Vicinamibacterales bacterium]|nr:TonB-dependent receptor [Vicinamibacterales bacterium]